MISSKDLLQDMYEAVKGIADKTYLLERPSSTSDSLNSFIVCNLPSAIYNQEMSDDGEYGYYTTTAQFEIYVRDRVTSSNINQVDIMNLSRVVGSVLSKFPMNLSHCIITNPVETLSISDGKQFHCTIIQGKLITK